MQNTEQSGQNRHHQPPLVALTRAIAVAISRVSELLEAEQQLLAGRDLHRLPALTAEKTDQAEKLEHLERERQHLLLAMGYQEANAEAMRQALAGLPGGHEANTDWEQALGALQRCQKLNQQSGIVLNNQRQQTQRALDILMGDQAQAVTYGPGGRENRPTPGHNLGKA